jgi:CheY-like chemotaxis protein
VDDQPVLRRILSLGLSAAGFDVRLAASGPEAVAVYREHGRDIDLVLLDVRMPGLDGPQTLAALREIDPTVRCCFMSGQAATYGPDELRALGAVGVIPKPFNLAELGRALRDLARPGERG